MSEAGTSDSKVTAPRPPARRRRWLWIALIASLAINALLIGIVLRSLWHMRSGFILTGGGLESGLPAFVGTLPRDRQEALRNERLADLPATLRPLRQELRLARIEAARAFMAEPFDKAAFVAAQGRLFEAEANLRRSVRQLLPDVAERMTYEERRAFLNWRGPGRGFGAWRGGDGGRNGRGYGPGGVRDGQPDGTPRN